MGTKKINTKKENEKMMDFMEKDLHKKYENWTVRITQNWRKKIFDD